MSGRHSLILVLLAAVTSAEVLTDGDCPKTMPKEMKPLYKCCVVEMDSNKTISDDQKAAVDSCVNTSKSDSDANKHDCMIECIFIKLGYMGEDKTINVDYVLKEMNSLLPEDFHEQTSKSLATCMGKKFSSTECPSEIDGVMACFSTMVLMNCPAKHWTDDEECKATRKFFQKCGDSIGYRYD
uniref:Odorant-binding protein 32 n=1 Tax=Apolygus lucorum TaxID=248454 RepID=A0A142FH99_APOLU|nr:odorant-binding protein 32 [Apolygus lucorum]